MTKKAMSLNRGGREGRMCCDHCSDTKYPCALWEKRLRGDEKDLLKPLPESDEGAPTGSDK